jgi:hypothetical protein
MRALFLPAAVAICVVAPEANAAAGAFASIAARDAAECARLCADDRLCIAWSFRPEGSCELRATAPAEPAGAAYGLSFRAPDALRHAPASSPAASPRARAAEVEAAVRPEDDVSQLLLGGLEQDATGLRH